MNIKPIGKAILFSFVEEARDGMFIPTTKSGIIMTNQNMDHNRTAKWGKVITKGSDVPDEIAKVGEYILIEPLQWTLSATIEGQKMWKTDETKVIASSSEIITAY